MKRKGLLLILVQKSQFSLSLSGGEFKSFFYFNPWCLDFTRLNSGLINLDGGLTFILDISSLIIVDLFFLKSKCTQFICFGFGL